MVEERRGMELSRIFACGLACAGCAANPEQNCRKPPLHRTSGQPSNEFHVYTPCFEPCVCVCASCAARKREAG